MKNRWCLPLMVLWWGMMVPCIFAADPSFEVAKNCRANLKMLKEATEKCLNDNKPEYPADVTSYDQIYTMFLTSKYMPQKPVPPTLDCEYFFIFKHNKNWDWFCRIHGVVSGDPELRLTYPYHEYEFTAFFKKEYMSSAKYKKHYDEVMRWTSYSRTLAESVKFNYSRNPTTTLLFVVIGVFSVWFIYRNIFD